MRKNLNTGTSNEKLSNFTIQTTTIGESFLRMLIPLIKNKKLFLSSKYLVSTQKNQN